MSVKKVVVANVATYLTATILQNMLEGWIGVDVAGTDKRTPKQKTLDALKAIVSFSKHKAHVVALLRIFKPAQPAKGEALPTFFTRLKTFGKSKPFFAAGCTALLAGNSYVAATSIPARKLYRKVWFNPSQPKPLKVQ